MNNGAHIKPALVECTAPPYIVIPLSARTYLENIQGLTGAEEDRATEQWLRRLNDELQAPYPRTVPDHRSLVDMLRLYTLWVKNPMYAESFFDGVGPLEPEQSTSSSSGHSTGDEEGVDTDGTEDELEDCRSGAGDYEPRRRLLSCEGGAHNPLNTTKIRFYASEAGNDEAPRCLLREENGFAVLKPVATPARCPAPKARVVVDDDALSYDSHISGLEGDAYAEALRERDYKNTPRLFAGIRKWNEEVVREQEEENDAMDVDVPSAVEEQGKGHRVVAPEELPRSVSTMDLDQSYAFPRHLLERFNLTHLGLPSA